MKVNGTSALEGRAGNSAQEVGTFEEIGSAQKVDEMDCTITVEYNKPM